VELYDTYQAKVRDVDAEVERSLHALEARGPARATGPEAPPPRRLTRQKNEPRFEVRSVLHALLGVDLTQIHGLGSYSALRIVAECGADMARWPTAKHFTSWLTLAPGSKISGGKVLDSRTRRSANRATSLLRMAALGVAKTSTALGAFFRRLAARTGKAKAVTATARKIAVLFYNTLRYGRTYLDPGASYYEERYRQRTLEGLRRRAGALGFTLVEAEAKG
jgi:transposase